MKSTNLTNFIRLKLFIQVFCLVCAGFFLSVQFALAASLSVSPGTGVYASGAAFTVNVRVNTAGEAINAAEGTLKFNPRELSVVSVSRASSIFNLWVTEPTFSNSAGTVSFSGGSPAGYTGAGGTIMSITFRSIGAGASKVSFSNGSVLANDGRGTNVLTSMNGGNFTIQAASAAPEPEVIEYVAPANTPAAPRVSSQTHPETNKWYTAKSAQLTWPVPAGVTAMRTLLNQNPTSVPTKVYETPISSITLDELPDGESYFHIQFQNADGWGRVTHYRLGVDSQKPDTLEITLPEDADLANPVQRLVVDVTDETSAVNRLKIKIDANEPYEVDFSTASNTVELPALDPGYHTVVIEAFDQAGNSLVSPFAFTILSFDRPVFTEYPSQINEEVIPVIKGLTRPNAAVEVYVKRVGGEPSTYEVQSGADGEFVFIPEGTFYTGVYELTARATDEYGAQSELSDSIRIAVQQPGYLQIGSFIVSVLSVIIPLLVLVGVLILGAWYLLVYFRRFRRTVGVESAEALEMLHREFGNLQTVLRKQEEALQSSRKTKKLTKAEEAMLKVFDAELKTAQQKVEKEIMDVKELTKQSDK